MERARLPAGGFEDKRKAKETQIYELERKVDGWGSELSHEKCAASDRIYNGERCVNFREEARSCGETCGQRVSSSAALALVAALWSQPVS